MNAFNDRDSEGTMDHERALELLPWLLNRTLEPVERRAVEEHLEVCAECRAELAESVEAWQVHAAHAPTDLLVDYGFGREIAAAARAALEAHLAHCRECQEDLERIVAEEEAVGPVQPERQPAARTISPLWRPLALAAMLIAVLGPVWLLRDAARPVAPQANVAVIDLLPEDFATRGAGELPVMLPREGPVVLVLVSDFAVTDADYRLRLLDAGEQTVWVRENVRPTENGDVSLLLAPAGLPAGDLVLELQSRQDQAAWTTLGRYRLTVTGAVDP